MLLEKEKIKFAEAKADNNPVIVFRQVSKSYDGGKIFALRDVNFLVQSGEFLCLVGPSGCGKSTILKIIAGLETQTSGEAAKPENVSMVFQSGALLPWLNVFDNVALGLRALGAHEKKIAEQCHKYIFMAGLSAFEQKYPRELSGGQRQRVGLARALAVEPEVLLLDEPFSALDTVTTEELHKDLIQIWKATKKTIVLVSHSIDEAVVLADRVILMKSGRLEEAFPIQLPRPRREQESLFIHEVHKIRNAFLK